MDKFSSKIHWVHMELGGKLLNSLRIKTQFLERLQSVSVVDGAAHTQKDDVESNRGSLEMLQMSLSTSFAAFSWFWSLVSSQYLISTRWMSRRTGGLKTSFNLGPVMCWTCMCFYSIGIWEKGEPFCWGSWLTIGLIWLEYQRKSTLSSPDDTMLPEVYTDTVACIYNVDGK